MKHKFNKQLLLPVVLYVVLFTFLFNTNPRELAIGWLLAPFALFFMALYFSFKPLFRRFASLSGRKVRILSGVAAAVPTLILLLDSVNQLTIRDVLLLMALGLVGIFYASRLRLR